MNHSMTPATQKASMGLSATATFTANHDCIVPAARLSIASSSFAPRDRISCDGQHPVPDADIPLAPHWNRVTISYVGWCARDGRGGPRHPAGTVAPTGLPPSGLCQSWRLVHGISAGCSRVPPAARQAS
jgi:hypothetical protein